MNQLLRSIFPKVFFASPVYFRAMMLGCLYLLMLILQLFAFEKMYGIVIGYGLPGGAFVASLVTGLIPVLGVLSLPFLFSMQVGERVWRWSRVAVVMLPSLWVTIVLFLGLAGRDTVNVGMFGAKVPLYFGWWALILVLSIFASAVIVVRELPRRGRPSKNRSQ